MFIGATQTRNGTTGEIHITHCLVEKRRIGGKVRQVILLNPGRQFPLAKEHRPEVCARIEPLLRGQQELLPTTVSESVERCAQHCFARLVAQSNGEISSRATAVATSSPPFFVEVGPDGLKLTRPHSIGVEYTGLAAMRAPKFAPLLASLEKSAG